MQVTSEVTGHTLDGGTIIGESSSSPGLSPATISNFTLGSLQIDPFPVVGNGIYVPSINPVFSVSASAGPKQTFAGLVLQFGVIACSPFEPLTELRTAVANIWVYSSDSSQGIQVQATESLDIGATSIEFLPGDGAWAVEQYVAGDLGLVYAEENTITSLSNSYQYGVVITFQMS